MGIPNVAVYYIYVKTLNFLLFIRCIQWIYPYLECMNSTHESPPSKRDQKRQAIARAALNIAAFDGWSEATITKAAVASGLPALEGRRLFPGGVMELLACYSAVLDTELETRAAGASLASMRVHERIAWLVRTRLEMMEPHKEAMRRAAAFMALPWNSGSGVQRVWAVSDHVWRLAGDTSTDFNYYTKRGLLVKVYVSTLLYWLNDTSSGHAESWEFLERRIQAVLTVGKRMGTLNKRVTEFVEQTADQLLNRRKYRTKR
jgi:ubiquinone biosynthesis protein COQ9